MTLLIAKTYVVERMSNLGYACPADKCGQEFTTSKALERHTRRHKSDRDGYVGSSELGTESAELQIRMEHPEKEDSGLFFLSHVELRSVLTLM